MALTGEQRRLARRQMRRRDRRIRIAWALSLLLHIVVGVLLLVTIRRKEGPELLPPPAPVTMVFESGRRNGPTEPEPSVQATQSAPQVPAVPLPTPPLPPPTPQQVPPPAAAEQVPPAIETPLSPPVEQPPVPPVEQVPVQPPRVPPVEQAPAQPLPVPPVEQLPVQPPPVPVKPVPAPKQPPVKQASPAKPPPFPAPMNFSFGTPPRPRVAAQPRLAPHVPGTIDMSLGPAAQGTADATPFSNHNEEADGADWRNALSRWVAEHAYYPEQARRDAEEGDARVHVVAAPDGRVKIVELVGRSGSMWLDLALLALFRDQHIPPLPFGVKEPIEFDFTMHYILIRPR